jgi:endoglucanase
LEKDESWGKAAKTWGTDKEYKELVRYMDMLKTTFVDKGIPVIIGEYGLGVSHSSKELESIQKYVASVAYESYIRGICPVLWDITDTFYSRSKYELKDPVIAEDFKKIIAGEYTP